MEIKLESEKEIIKNGDQGIFNSVQDIKTYLSHVILNKKKYILDETFLISEKTAEFEITFIVLSICMPLILTLISPKFLLIYFAIPAYFGFKYTLASKKVNNLIITLKKKLEISELNIKENNYNKTNNKTIENTEVDKFIAQIIKAMRIAKEAKYDGYMQDIVDLKKLSNDYIEYNIEEKTFGEVNFTIDIDWFKRLTDIEERISQNMKNYKYKLQNTKAVNQEFEDTILDLTLDNPFNNLQSKQKVLKK